MAHILPNPPTLVYPPGVYHNSATFQYLLKADLSVESQVSKLWMHILQYYFPISEGYCIATEHYTFEKTKIDVLVTHVCPLDPKGEFEKWVLLVELKGKGKESFDEAYKQLEGYLKSKSVPNKEGHICGVLAIGRQAKFYSLKTKKGSRTIKAITQDDAKRPKGEDRRRPIDIGEDIGLVHDFMVDYKTRAGNY